MVDPPPVQFWNAEPERADPFFARRAVPTLLVAALPVVVLIYLFRLARGEPPEAAVGELLVRELSADEPLLLPGPVFGPKALTPPAARVGSEPDGPVA